MRCIIQCDVLSDLLYLMCSSQNPVIQFNSIWALNNILSHHELISFLSFLIDRVCSEETLELANIIVSVINLLKNTTEKTICTTCIWCINTIIELAEACEEYSGVEFILDHDFTDIVIFLPGVSYLYLYSFLFL